MPSSLGSSMQSWPTAQGCPWHGLVVVIITAERMHWMSKKSISVTRTKRDDFPVDLARTHSDWFFIIHEMLRIKIH